MITQGSMIEIRTVCKTTRAMFVDDKGKRIYDLEERTAVFGERIIDFVKTLPENIVNRELIRQLVKAGTSVGANYNEADGAESKKDFRHKIGQKSQDSG